MKNCLIFLVLLFPIIATSCVSTNVYEKSIIRAYRDNSLVSEQIKIQKDGKFFSENSKTVRTASVKDGISAVATIETSSKEQYDKTTIKLFKNGVFIAEKEFKSKNGALIYDATASQTADKEKKYKELIDYGDFVYVEGSQKIQSFFANKKEVTQEQYNAVMGKNPSKNVGEKFPVEQISLFDALEFCNKMSISENRIPCYRMLGNTWYFDTNADGYRLLTGDEFQYAAKGGKQSSSFEYSGSSSASQVSWVKSNSGKHTHEVAKKKANVLGIYDMSGNVWEWVWQENYTVCGGSALEPSSKATVTSKANIKQGDVYEDVGFRIARNVTAKEKSAFEEKKKFEDKLPTYFSSAFRQINKKNKNEQKTTPEDIDDFSQIKSFEKETYVEKVTVESSPNTGYIAYSFLGKPFVIVGSSVWNILKCTGYAFVNFIGGYGTVTNGNFLWMMPDTEKAKEKARIARENNGISHYPEYHKPFTDNKISVYSYKQKGGNEFRHISSETLTFDEQHQSYDNTISVSRSATSDAQATAAVVGLIGTGVTVPVSVIMWGGGFVAGIAMSVVENMD